MNQPSSAILVGWVEFHEAHPPEPLKDPKAKRASQIQSAIGRILHHDWDPISVSSYGPQDEYDG